ncbi:allophanate hydrolase [Dactylosporangium sp. CS-033363]|uniref:allophanate hydrolase n=1 Tax=Dactylosporangium sp. CS-033363 TaxID=3239935 RepID=UPI003D8FA484
MTHMIWISRFDPAEVERRRRDAPDGPLHGQAFAVKDNIDVEGLATTAACPALEDRVAKRSATAVRRLEEAGAVPLGKTNMDQFATGLVGTRSPYGASGSVFSAAHVSGGSSSGSALAVAAGEVPLALGTDTAGSGRVPAAFNGIVGLKPTRGLVSTAGVLPACRSLDCVTTFTRTVGAARQALDLLVGADPDDAWSRAAPPRPPAHVAARPRVIGVPDGPIDLDPEHAVAWKAALDHAARVGRLVPVPIGDFLAAATLLYGGPWLAERWHGFGHLLETADPIVKGIVTPGRNVTGAEVFAGLDRLAGFRQATEPIWYGIDALLLPTTPGHPTFADVAAEPVAVNARLGTYTNFVNLLDLCAVAVPAGHRPDRLPFGVQFIGPAFADHALLDLAARWTGETIQQAGKPGEPGTTLVAVVGAHMSGLPLNGELVGLGAALEYRARTASGYRLFRLPGPGVPRPGLVRTGDGPAAGIALEVWRLPRPALGALLDGVPAPLGLGRITLDDGTEVLGFLAEEHGIRDGVDISAAGGWRHAF